MTPTGHGLPTRGEHETAIGRTGVRPLEPNRSLKTGFSDSNGSDPQSDGAQERVHDGPQYAFELSMFMCPAVHITTRS